MLTEDAAATQVLTQCGTYEEYFRALGSSCTTGESGRLEWTPDDNTPDIVYYQVTFPCECMVTGKPHSSEPHSNRNFKYYL